MEASASISARNYMLLTFFFMLGTSILIAPAGLAEAAGQDAWMAAVVGIGLNFGFAAVYLVLAERHPGQSLAQIAETLLGMWAGRVVACLFSLFFYLLAALMVGDMGYFMTSQILTETPIEALEILFVMAIVSAVRSGLRGYAYAAEIFFPWIALLLVLFVLPLLPVFDANRLKPMFEKGALPIFKGGMNFFGLQELIVLFMLYQRVEAGVARRRGFMLGVALGGLVLIMMTTGCIGVLEAPVTANNLYPAYTLAKNIKIGRFLERIEGIMIFIWICSIFLKITLTFHASLIGFRQTFRISDERAILWPLAIGLIGLSLVCYPDMFFIIRFLSTSWLPFSAIFLVVLPLLLLTVSLLRGRSAGTAPSSAATEEKSV
ncbi:endospore germination permease [Cohnella sp. GCM10020058]|uniref:GerAB/ArcD/ProY family transporter n=1 Tax=Cohnella sp. GCM10020058 TaxID=3317330 RepID=UPI00364427AB